MEHQAIAAPLAAALAARGYDRLTAVQTAVTAEGLAGRDLLVSAQTGSGKTVAFGLAMAEDMLAGPVMAERGAPTGLVIAPTRELALQVARELSWLYETAGVRVATCVGGMDYRTERRALAQVPHLVIGTPGRLRDHLERGSLDLTGLRVAVLDEADEMLDLGFAEDLAAILGAAPADRRTLMFSATVPPEIAALAAETQRDALRIVAAGEASQHVDIAYQAVSIQPRDRENAIFNILRLHEARAAIVFCKTRANVAHLTARMGNRGMQVVALSGELSQSERTHALQALRDGRARVCIATDVAARGIDLPGLELVIHADLPGSPEVLLHRSGRTGRAGRKGSSVLIVPPAEFRKAQRILKTAQVNAEWTKAPSAEAVQEADEVRLLDDPGLWAAEADAGDLPARLLAAHGPDAVARALVSLWRAGRGAPEVLSDAVLPTEGPAGAARAPSEPPRDRAAFGPSVWFRLNAGHDRRAEARWLLPKICEAAGIARDAIGAIRVKGTETFVQIAEAAAPKFGTGLELEAGLDMARMETPPDLDRPSPKFSSRPARDDRPRRDERGDRPERAERPARPERSEPDERPPRRDSKPDWQPKSAGFKSHGGGGKPDRPAKSAGFKSHGGPRPERSDRPTEAARPERPARDDRPARDERPARFERPQGEEAGRPAKRPYAPKPYAPKGGGAKPAESGRPGKPSYGAPKGDGPRPGKPAFGKGRPAKFGGAKPAPAGGETRPKRPAKPPQDARDTSRRFTPPKRPKS